MSQNHYLRGSLLIKSFLKSLKDNSDLFLNRELSWLEFNARVLNEGLQTQTPLLERLFYLSIFTKNQDEFFMVRVAGLKKMLSEGFIYCESPDKMPIKKALESIQNRSQALCHMQYECFNKQLLPALEKESVKILNYKTLNKSQKSNMSSYFTDEVFPVLTPLAVDSSHPFPFLNNLSIYFLVEFKADTSYISNSEKLFGFVEIPSIIPRLIPIENKTSSYHFVLLDSIVEAHLQDLFLGFEILNCTLIRVTRNLDYTLLENRVVDLLESIQKEVIHKTQPEAVRLEVDKNISDQALKLLKKTLKLDHHDIYKMPKPMFLPSLIMDLHKLPLPHLKHESFNPRLPKVLGENNSNIFSLIKERDILVHHPYESFYAITEFLSSAANDPDVYAIKQTLYRSSGDSPIIEALIRAAENGKQVTVVVELKARFDEKNNIVWARRLERSGVHVVYGFVGLKTHCKTTLIVRKEENKLVRYVHLSTGNYNSQTAKIYTDLGLLTANRNFGKDISALFNFLTGFNILKEKVRAPNTQLVPKFKELILSPLYLRKFIIAEINRVIEDQKKYGNGRIIVKINGLDDQYIIEELYKASQSGVDIKLIVRGICCLRPGIKGLSENIKVVSIIDRFLEHSRIYYFSSGSTDQVYLGSADWMTRNMERRIELMFPIQDQDLKEKLILEILKTYLKDNTHARTLNKDGTYSLKLPKKGESKIRAQQEFIGLAREDGIKSIPYEKAIHYDLKRRGRRPVATKASQKK